MIRNRSNILINMLNTNFLGTGIRQKRVQFIKSLGNIEINHAFGLGKWKWGQSVHIEINQRLTEIFLHIIQQLPG